MQPKVTRNEIGELIRNRLDAQRVQTGKCACENCGWRGDQSIESLVDLVITYVMEKPAPPVRVLKWWEERISHER